MDGVIVLEGWKDGCKCDGGSSKEARGRECFIESARAPSLTSRRWDWEANPVTVFILFEPVVADLQFIAEWEACHFNSLRGGSLATHL